MNTEDAGQGGAAQHPAPRRFVVLASGVLPRARQTILARALERAGLCGARSLPPVVPLAHAAALTHSPSNCF